MAGFLKMAGKPLCDVSVGPEPHIGPLNRIVRETDLTHKDG